MEMLDEILNDSPSSQFNLKQSKRPRTAAEETNRGTDKEFSRDIKAHLHEVDNIVGSKTGLPPRDNSRKGLRPPGSAQMINDDKEEEFEAILSSLEKVKVSL